MGWRSLSRPDEPRLLLSLRVLTAGSSATASATASVQRPLFIWKVTLKLNPLLMITSNSVSCYIIIMALIMAGHHAPCCLQQWLNYADWTQTSTESVSVCQRLFVGLAGRQDSVFWKVLKHKSQKVLDAKFAAVQKLPKVHMHALKWWLFPPLECSPAHSTHNCTVTQLLSQSLVNVQDTACPPECFSLSAMLSFEEERSAPFTCTSPPRRALRTTRTEN